MARPAVHKPGDACLDLAQHPHDDAFGFVTYPLLRLEWHRKYVALATAQGFIPPRAAPAIVPRPERRQAQGRFPAGMIQRAENAGCQSLGPFDLKAISAVWAGAPGPFITTKPDSLKASAKCSAAARAASSSRS